MHPTRSLRTLCLPLLLPGVSPLHSAAWQAPNLAALEYVEVQKPVHQPFGPGSQVFFGGGKDVQGYFRGSGISPFSRLVVAQMSTDAEALLDTTPEGRHDRALKWMRFTGTAAASGFWTEPPR